MIKRYINAVFTYHPSLTNTPTFWWNRELTLKCKLKCYVKHMKDPLGVSPSIGNQGTTRGKEKILLTSVGIEPTTSGTYACSTMNTNGGTERGSIPIEVKRIFSLPRVVP